MQMKTADQIRRSSKKPGRSKMRPVVSGLLMLLVLVGFLCFFSARWYVNIFGQLGFDAVLYTLSAGFGDVASGLLNAYAASAALPALVCTLVAGVFLLPWCSKKVKLHLFSKIHIQLFPLRRSVAVIGAVLLSAVLIADAADGIELDEYLKAVSDTTDLYDEYYQDPQTTQITFPAEKRNLIYIFLESMETAYLSTELGGASDSNLIPELAQLAQENVNFSFTDTLGGFYAPSGTTWTVGALVAQTSGVPLKTPPGVDQNYYGHDGNYLPGLTTIMDVLHDNGYYQALMLGSIGTYAARQQYFYRHGVDQVYDLYCAQEDGIVPQDYFVWWGMEDKYLFEYAKQELTQIAAQDEPFAFSMLTVDTHHVGGYVCEYCQDTYEEQYQNVISCSSRQVYDFIEWCSQQDFYDNTTIVICGDHPSMDHDYFTRNVDETYDRTVYNCFINAAADASNTQNRVFTSLDIFPTTLAAMGCQIGGDRLGLGTNLFSDRQTLAEEIGLSQLDEELAKTSLYYSQNFYFQ